MSSRTLSVASNPSICIGHSEIFNNCNPLHTTPINEVSGNSVDVRSFLWNKSFFNLEQAYVFIEKAWEKDGENASLWYVYGIAGEKKDPDKALAAFIKAIDINPEYWEAMYMAGKIHYDRGYNANKLAQEIPLDDAEGYKAAVALTDEHFKQALPYFEAAIAIEGDDAQTLNALKELYYRFKENDKLAAINKKIEELK